MVCARLLTANAALVLLLSSTAVLAVPYASQVRNTSGNSWEFVLNESADSITILRDGANPVSLSSPAAGRHTFDMTGFNDFEIQVAKDAPKAWTELSDASNLHTYYFRPNGVVVNQDPSSPYFGTVYISHPLPVAEIPNVTQRAMGEGIYSLSADLISVDLANNFAAQTNANDASLAKLPTGWSTANNGGSSPWQIALDDSGNLIASDFSDQHGGFKYADPNLVNGGLVLRFEDGDRAAGLFLNGNNEEVHGSIQSKPMVTGTVGVDLTIWGVDEDLDIDGDSFTSSDDAYSVWRWDAGSQTNYDGAPALEIASTAIDVDEALWFSISVDGIYHDAHYEPQFNKFYLTQSRTHGNESSLIIVTPDGVDGMSPTIEFASKQWSIDNDLDGNNSNVEELGGGIQDIFRSFGSLTIAPDGSKMYVHLAEQFTDDDIDGGDGNNPFLGAGSVVGGGGILVIPLDENGLPVIDVDDNGTPGDTSDDFITNIESIDIEGQLSRHVRAPISLDAAGNVYVTNNISELLQVFSPGGNTLAITGSDGSFIVTEPGVGLAGDYNNDGVVDAADYTNWRDTLGDSVATGDGADGNGNGVIDSGDYDVWRDNYGASSSAAAGTGVAPEPAAAVLLLVSSLMGIKRRR
ncbi:hypothetical protein KOR34_20460 [Posidoniimonas corsicana]|uniref:Uncharacterized protein n=2 Tax=Posidoniimonas corsicana TaxID=1938618 RepID=A0A5C5VGS2_9BACT|nr:hypothetical protein KOR34_20460 [Posidoniimonas corsicana]